MVSGAEAGGSSEGGGVDQSQDMVFCFVERKEKG